ncbi:MAG: hypothetical protein ACLSFM_09055 [Agathobacter rectalis]
MSKYIPGNQKHLSLEDRIYIENELNVDLYLKLPPIRLTTLVPDPFSPSFYSLFQRQFSSVPMET